MTIHEKRSIGDVAKQMVHPGKDAPKNEDLQELIRLCGKSFLYLPSEYAPCSLILPTSLRATAHYLIQHGMFCNVETPYLLLNKAYRNWHTRGFPYTWIDPYCQRDTRLLQCCA